MISTILLHKFSAFIFNEKHSFFYIYNSWNFVICSLITGVFFNSLQSVAREFSQNKDANEDLSSRFMDVNEDLSPRVMDDNEDLSPRLGMEFDTLKDAREFWLKYGR